MATTKDILVKAKEIIEKRGWSKRANARDKNFNSVMVDSKDAIRFCVAGACTRVVYELNEHGPLTAHAWSALNIAVESSHSSAVDFNDDPKTTKEDILKLFDRAILDCEPKGVILLC